MKLFKEIKLLQCFLHEERQKGKQIGFVPTMGALHEGHLSLIRASRAENQLTVCSIFVNPTQFTHAEDLVKYPRPIENDIKLLVESECDVLFYPEISEMYIGNEKTTHADYGDITEALEGQFRPGHFDGVITIVRKLFDIITPHVSYFGQKDYQQCLVIKELIEKNKLNIQLRMCPTLRENDGLAMSSRNVRLSKEERKAAVIIPEMLFHIKKHITQQPLKEILSWVTDRIITSSELFKIEYLKIVDANTLKPLQESHYPGNAVALIAVWCGNVRLIDNMILTD